MKSPEMRASCAACGHENPLGARFCNGCGAPLAPRCASCNTENPPGARFCNGCGAALGSAAAAPVAATPAPARDPRTYTPKHLADKILRSKSALEGERKQVTVLFADVKGSMELAEQLDPETWHRILERFFEILTEGVHRFEGTVNQYTGDGIMALFGAPIAHEDHAQRACYAALALRDALREFSRDLKRQHGLDFATRVGINSGEVVVGKIGDDLRMDYTAQGAVVGLAQRMEALASAGSLYVSAATAALVTGYFALDDLGEVRVKGASEPVRVFELTGLGALRTRFDRSRARGLSRFAGRASEMATLEAALEQALTGRGRVVGVVADAGTGKSRLCFEFAERCRARGITVRTTTGVSHGKAVPLLPVLDFYRSTFGITDRDDARAARQKIAGAVVQSDESLVSALPLLFDFLGVPDPERPVTLEPGPERLRALLAALKRLILARSRREPAVIVFEDLHWIDEATGVFLENLVDATDASRTLLLVNFRPEYRADWMRRSYYQQLALAPLTSEAFGEMLGETLGADGSVRELAARVHERSGGNPFFAEEIVQALIESGALVGALGAYRLTRSAASLEIPATVQLVLAARIDRLGEREKSVLQSASVIGREFSESLLRRVAGLDAESLSAVLHALVQGEFLHETALYPEVEYAFKHPLTQEVAYGSQLRERRARVHEAVARALEASVDPERPGEHAALLAHHYDEAGCALEAARWHARAAAWMMSSDSAEAYRHWLRARVLAARVSTDETREIEDTALVALVNLGWRMGRPTTESRELFEAARRLFEASGDRRSLCLLHSNFSLSATTTGGDFSESVACYRESTRLARELADPWLELTVGVAIMPGVMAGLLREALGWANACIELIGTRAPSGPLLAVYEPRAWIYTGRGYTRTLLGDVAGAIADSDRALDLARELDDYDRLLAHRFRCEIDVFRGEVGGALEHGRRNMELSEKLGTPVNRVAASAVLGTAFGRAGHWQEARPLLEESRALKDQIGAPRGDPGLASALLHCGEPERALIIAREGAAETASLGAQLTELQIQIELAEIAARCGHEAEARVALARASELAARTECKMLVPAIHEAAAVLAETLKDGERQQTELREALRLYQALGATGHAERVARELAP